MRKIINIMTDSLSSETDSLDSEPDLDDHIGGFDYLSRYI